MKTVSAFYVSLNSKSCVRKTRFDQFEVKYEYLNKSRSMALFIRIMQGKTRYYQTGQRKCYRIASHTFANVCSTLKHSKVDSGHHKRKVMVLSHNEQYSRDNRLPLKTSSVFVIVLWPPCLLRRQSANIPNGSDIGTNTNHIRVSVARPTQ